LESRSTFAKVIVKHRGILFETVYMARYNMSVLV